MLGLARCLPTMTAQAVFLKHAEYLVQHGSRQVIRSLHSRFTEHAFISKSLLLEPLKNMSRHPASFWQALVGFSHCVTVVAVCGVPVGGGTVVVVSGAVVVTGAGFVVVIGRPAAVLGFGFAVGVPAVGTNLMEIAPSVSVGVSVRVRVRVRVSVRVSEIAPLLGLVVAQEVS